MKIAITGHRPNKLGGDYDLVSPLIQKIEARIEIYLIELGILSIYTDADTVKRIKYNEESNTTFITGMALGIDTLFAQIAIKYGIPFIAAIPFKGQERKWPDKSKRIYHDILSKADQIIVADQNIIYHDYEFFFKLASETAFTNKKMQDRNEIMVNLCDRLIAVWDGSPGGTANCIKYAESIGRNIEYINPKSL